MNQCLLCLRPVEETEILCEECIRELETGDRSFVELVRGKAKQALKDIMRELCKHCSSFNEEVSSEVCKSCKWHAKERLVRAFLG